MSSLALRDFVGGRMLQSKLWKPELEFARAYRSFEPWLVQAINNQEVDLWHPFLTRSPSSVSAADPIHFNKIRYTSWEELAEAPIKNYRGAELLEDVASWEFAGVVERVPEAEMHLVTFNPLQVIEGAAETVNGVTRRKRRPVLHTVSFAVTPKADLCVEGIRTF